MACLGVLTNFLALLLMVTTPANGGGALGGGKGVLSSVFNSMLASLLGLHSLYILAAMTHVLRVQTPSALLDLLFTHLLYPLKPLFLHAATLLTVIMARERCKAIRHPLEYRNATAGLNPWRCALKYVGAIVGVSALFVSPLYFETARRPVTQEVVVSLVNSTSLYLVSKW